jgi:23S rRNA (cytidine1920-2'-O)/16S rRNA (cytidine1409-2'-O)-methyltransferase
VESRLPLDPRIVRAIAWNMSESDYVSRGGLKLRHALDAFGINPLGMACADLGCSTGGFTDCLLRAGAARVTAVDTAYGELAWKLRTDARVAVLERTNALHAAPTELVDLVVADMGWTPQRLLVPAATRWLKPDATGLISLIKPHYELSAAEKSHMGRGGVLDADSAIAIVDRVVSAMPELGVSVRGLTRSPILGGHAKTGNPEWLAWMTPSRG